MSTEKSYRELARLVARHDRQLSARPQHLIHSTIQGGATKIRDESGALTGLVGKQWDGTFGAITVGGPKPPVPANFTAWPSPSGGGLVVRWEGEWEPLASSQAGVAPTPVVAPMTFARVEVHGSTDPNFSGLLSTTFRSSIPSPRGGETMVAVDYDTDVWFRLVARTSDGQASTPSSVIGPFRVPRPTKEDLDIDWDALGGSTIYRGPDEPTGNLKYGDLWLQTPNNVAHRWEAPGEWVESRDQGIVEAINTAVDAAGAAEAAGITASDAATLAATAKGLAETAQQTADSKITIYRRSTAPPSPEIGDYWINTSDGNRPSVWDGDSWESVQDQAIVTAINNAATAQNTADGKARVFVQSTAPTGLAATDFGDIWIDTSRNNLTLTWDGDSWEQRQISNESIKPNSLVASNIVATGTVSAALLEAILVLVNTVIAGDPEGLHSRLDQTGLAAYATASDGLPIELGRYGRGWSVRNDDGQITATASDAGDLTVQTLSSADPDPEFGGVRLSEINWMQPRGLVAYGGLGDLNTWGPKTNTELGFMELAWIAEAGRECVLNLEPIEFACDTGDVVRLRVRWTSDGSTPTITSPILAEVTFSNLRSSAQGWNNAQSLRILLGGPGLGSPTESRRLLLTYGTGAGSTGAQVSRNTPIRAWIEDMGPKAPNTGVESSGGGSTTPALTTKTDTWHCTWSRSWRQNGTINLDNDDVYQGYGDSFNGIQRGGFGFPSTIQSVISGATIEKLEIFLYAEHWWYMNGGTARIGSHGSITPPSSPTAFSNDFSVNYTARGQGRWINITSSLWKNGLLNGSIRGFSVYHNTTSAQYYGRFSGVNGGTTRVPKIRIRYTK